VSLRFHKATVEKVQRNREQTAEQRNGSGTAPQPVGCPPASGGSYPRAAPVAGPRSRRR
jgi:hypothetical protein